ncbi:MAG: radical SAM/Cys-rich domain protein [Proteobacteria bacterium]|nr:radical SAM/Cys-rich domain protein [Pseudomonadota bacterium]NOG58908.1 radical SAM/Cys-rich domain protein [Pseudomonadota bacterium]
MHDTLPYLNKMNFPVITRKELNTVQINIGLKCNQQCVHCHVNSSPKRTEMMSPETVESVKEFLVKNNIQTLDITGGAPELHSEFKNLVLFAKKNNIHVIDRCNLTILSEPGMNDLAQFLAINEVEIVASLPCYLEKNVDAQRGKGVFERSIAGLQQLNSFGYGKPESNLILNLVYNPQGPVLPPSQEELEITYKKELSNQYNIEFNQLFTLCNMPIQRFGSTLVSKNELNNYMNLLKNSFRKDNLENVMCRHLISIDWQGNVYDCDFNQMLGLNMRDSKKQVHVSELTNTGVKKESIAVRDHCYGCTAGQGSSCSGALV